MVFYFAAFAACHLLVGFCAFWLDTSSRWTVRGTLTHVVAVVSLSAVAAWVMQHCSAPHAFTLADNRHYVFYVWRRVLDHSGVSSRVTLAPLFGLSAWLCCRSLRETRSLLWSAAFFGTSLVLVLTPLLEPRYFTIPLLFLRLHQVRDKSLFCADDARVSVRK
jgi:alpha-1,2-glucosyltransferase